MSWLADFAWLRPHWLWGLLVLPLLPFALRRLAARGSAWTRAVDAHLLPHLLDAGSARGTRLPAVLLVLGTAIAIVALAGPSLRQQKAPLWQVRSPLMIAVDLSAAMRATDLKPSRAAQARLKIGTLLKERRGGQVGLIAYAGDAYDVAPLTRDARTVAALVDQLDPDVMPDEGQRADRAIRRAVSRMRGAGFAAGDILLITDHVDDAGRDAAAQAHADGFRVHVLGIGTTAGAPLATAEGFLTDDRGQVQFARLDAASLAAAAASGGGRQAVLSIDDSDLRALGVLDPQAQSQEGGVGEQGVRRADDGYWLLLALLPLALLAFRRHWLAMLPFAVGIALLQAPQAVRAAEPATPAASDGWWDALWQRRDQRAHDALVAGDAKRARTLATDSATRGAAEFRGGDFAGAAHEWAGSRDADGQYNRGNALAQAGRYEDALAAYDAALAQAPEMDDAIENRRIVAEQLEKQKQQQRQQDGDGKDGKQPDEKDGQDKQQSPQGDEKQQGDQQQGDQQQDQQQQDQQGGQDQQQGSQQQSQQGDDGKPGDDGKEGEEEGSADAQAQQQAADAQKQAMEQALAGQAKEAQEGEGEQRARVLSPAEREQAEREQALEQWLMRVPDDPGGLLRRKFALEHQRRQQEGDDE